MHRIFTQYLRSLDCHGNPPDTASFNTLWSALHRAVRSEVKKRGVWDSPPCYLGIFGWDSWLPDAREELVAECYDYIFLHRLSRLKAHLELKSNIDGLVFLNIRHFLHERQKTYDPIGYRTYEVVLAAARESISAGHLLLLAGESSIRNDTILICRLGNGRLEHGSTPARRSEIAAHVASWGRELLPDLITAPRRYRHRIISRLRQRLEELALGNFGGFYFRDLVDPLKAEVRKSWAAALEHTLGETAHETDHHGQAVTVRLVQPSRLLEERQAFAKLVTDISSILDSLDAPRHTRCHLSTLWRFLATSDETLPSHRQLSTRLSIPRDRLPGLFATLREILLQYGKSHRQAGGGFLSYAFRGEVRAGSQ